MEVPVWRALALFSCLILAGQLSADVEAVTAKLEQAGDWELVYLDADNIDSIHYRQNKNKLILDLFGAGHDEGGGKSRHRNRLVKELRWARHDDGGYVRFVIETHGKAGYRIVRRGDDLLIVLSKSPMDGARVLEELSMPDTAEFASIAGPVPPAIANVMQGTSMHGGCPVGMDRLAYLQLRHRDMRGGISIGEMVVHKDVALEIASIFKILFDAGFPIEKMRPVSRYDGSDAASMRDNNTSAFNCRKMTGRAGRFSKHSYGKALDINPRWNPYVTKKGVMPPGGESYTDRSLDWPGMIRKGDACHRAFKKAGWRWGGEWRTIKDYQHFEKIGRP